MVALPHDRERKFTVNEYLTIERAAEFKSEFLCGRIYAMAGASPRHTRINANVIAALHQLLNGSECGVHTNDLRIRSSPEGLYTYPDATVVCGDLEFHEGTDDVVTNPTLIVEVLSPTTEEYDRGKKGEEYAEIASLQEYILVWQDRPEVEVRSRKSLNQWLVTVYTGLEVEVGLESLSAPISMRSIYQGVDFPNPESAGTGQR